MTATRTPKVWARRAYCLLLSAGVLWVNACQQKMAQAPYFRTQEHSDFFEDGRSARPLEPGVFSRSQLLDDSALITGLTAEGRRGKPKPKSDIADETSPEGALPGAPNSIKNFVEVFPFKLEEADLRRGQERYTIFCTPCHGALGDGKGKIPERGNLRPTAYYPLRDKEGKIQEGTGVARGFQRFGVQGDDGKPLLLRDAPVGYYFEVVSKGYGVMADYSAQIPPEDRWRIIAYIRTLQLSQSAKLTDLPEAEREEAIKALGGKQP